MIQSKSNITKTIGQLFMAPIPGTDLDEGTIDLVKNHGVSKFIIFQRNVADGPERLRRLCFDVKRLCRKNGLYPILAIDQEGGPVRRLRPPLFDDMLSPDDVRKSKEPEKKVVELAESAFRLIRPFSIDMNLAPVLDLCLHGEKNVLKARCLGKDPLRVARLGGLYIKRLKELGILSTCKHFPGIGRVRLDPHHHLPKVDVEKDLIMKELYPFKQAIKSGCPAVMTSHVVYEKIDPKQPATFSHKIATSLLKKSLKFKGVLITDDLEMKGAMKVATHEMACFLALKAGHDLLLICKSPKKVRESISFLQYAIKDAKIPENRIMDAINRVKWLEINKVS